MFAAFSYDKGKMQENFPQGTEKNKNKAKLQEEVLLSNREKTKWSQSMGGE